MRNNSMRFIYPARRRTGPGTCTRHSSAVSRVPGSTKPNLADLGDEYYISSLCLDEYTQGTEGTHSIRWPPPLMDSLRSQSF